MLPPCKDVLLQKLVRCNYVAFLWKHAGEKDPLKNMKPTDHGWKDSNGFYVPVWFTGRQMPNLLSATMDPTDIFNEEGEEDDDEDNNDEEEDIEEVSDYEYDSDYDLMD